MAMKIYAALAAMLAGFLEWISKPVQNLSEQYLSRMGLLWRATDTAYQTQYRQEIIMGFEQHQTLTRATVTTEAVIKGNTAIFLVVDSGGAVAVNRGVNGLIPARADANTQNTCTLTEWHDLVRKTSFNIFASQGNQREVMQKTSIAVINRKIDSQIIDVLNTGTVTIGSSTTIPNVSLFQNGRVKLSNASVPWDSRITLLCQPPFLAYMEQAPEFANAQYVTDKPYGAGDSNPSWQDKPMVYRWRNALIMEHPNLPGKGTSSEKSFLYHQSSTGHAANTGEMESEVGYNGEQAYSWARASIFMGAVLMQNAGVVVITHDGSAYA